MRLTERNERQEKQVVNALFADYYRTAEIEVPSIEKREFGIGNIRKIDARHLAFQSANEFKNYLLLNTPMFVSHSTSYYEFPDATPMERKGLQGADLVFDLDLHGEGKYGAYFLLEKFKQDVLRLVNDFIVNDFGLNRNDVVIVFSGNRGYHIHVRDKSILSLGSEERRELVDYVLGIGLDYKQFFSFSNSKPPKLLGPTPHEGGYRGRLARGAIELIGKTPGKLSRTLTGQRAEFFVSGINEGNWSRISISFEDLIKRLKIVADTLPVSSVDTDAGVTQDMSKLIRVPNSIHGETGLVAKIVKNLDEFGPFRHALLPIKIETQMLKIRFVEDVPELKMIIETDAAAGPHKKDEIKEFPANLALFFILKKSAILATIVA